MSRLINGNIYEIPLPNNFGLGYVKYINSREELLDSGIPDILLFYNCLSKSAIQDCSEINRNLLIAPITITGSSRIPKLNWRVIGNEAIKESEKWLPDVKSGWPPLVKNPDKWVYLEELGNTLKMHFSDLSKVNHLDWNRSMNVEIVGFRLYVEFLRKEEKELDDKYELNFFEKEEYEKIKDLPIYSLLPNDIKGKAIH